MREEQTSRVAWGDSPLNRRMFHMELLHNRETCDDACVGDWIDDCDDCWDRLLDMDDATKIAIKGARGRFVIAKNDLAFIVQRETIDEFAESVGVGVIREMWLADPSARTGRYAPSRVA